MATLVALCREIDARMREGESFSSIEDDVIQASELPEEHKSALWPYGWSFVLSRRPSDARPMPT